MCKTNEKTRQYYFFTARQTVSSEAEKTGFAKIDDEIIIDFGGRKTTPNTFHSCTITANI